MYLSYGSPFVLEQLSGWDLFYSQISSADSLNLIKNEQSFDALHAFHLKPVTPIAAPGPTRDTKAAMKSILLYSCAKFRAGGLRHFHRLVYQQVILSSTPSVTEARLWIVRRTRG